MKAEWTHTHTIRHKAGLSSFEVCLIGSLYYTKECYDYGEKPSFSADGLGNLMRRGLLVDHFQVLYARPRVVRRGGYGWSHYHVDFGPDSWKEAFYKSECEDHIPGIYEEVENPDMSALDPEDAAKFSDGVYVVK